MPPEKTRSLKYEGISPLFLALLLWQFCPGPKNSHPGAGNGQIKNTAGGGQQVTLTGGRFDFNPILKEGFNELKVVVINEINAPKALIINKKSPR